MFFTKTQELIPNYSHGGTENTEFFLFFNSTTQPIQSIDYWDADLKGLRGFIICCQRGFATKAQRAQSFIVAYFSHLPSTVSGQLFFNSKFNTQNSKLLSSQDQKPYPKNPLDVSLNCEYTEDIGGWYAREKKRQAKHLGE